MQGVGKSGEIFGLKDVAGTFWVCLVFVVSWLSSRFDMGPKRDDFATAICSIYKLLYSLLSASMILILHPRITRYNKVMKLKI